MTRILALALLALLAGSSPAAADPISLAIGALVTSIGSIGATVGAFVTGLGVLGKALISIGLSLALSFVSSLFRPKPKQAEGGVQSQIQIGGDVPRSAIFGKQATAGHIVYVNTSGNSNAVLEMVFAIGDGRHERLSRVWVNGKETGLTQPGADPYYVADGFDGKLTLTYQPGTYGQSALPSLVSSANPSGRWSTDHKLNGIAHLVARLQYDEKVFPNGVPQLLFEMEGLRLYDPRFDSTNGETGSQRWDDPTTWVYSENPAVQLYNYQRGIYLNGERVLGMGLPASDLNTASYIAAANICDETVSLAGGGTETRYRCGFIVSDGMQHSEVIDRFVEAMGGVIAERAGLYTVFAGVAQTSVVTITDGDLVLGRPRTFSAKKSRTERVNAVFGTYSSPDEQWKPVAFPAFTSDTFEADDGGERLAVNLDLVQVFSVTQAQRLAMIQRRLGRLQGTAEISLPFAYIRIEAGDWMTWQSERFGFTKVWQVVSARIEADQTIRLSLREIATSVFSWISGDDELEVAQPGLVPSRPPLAGGLSGFAAAPVTIEGDNGSAAPAIRATWNPIEDETVAAVIIEHRIGASGEARQTRSVNRLGGFAVIADGIQPNTTYQVRGTIETVPARAAKWSSWVSVTTDAAQASAGSVDWSALELATQAGLEAAAKRAQEYRDLVEQLAAQAQAMEQQALDNRATVARRVEAVSGQASARLLETYTVLASADAATAATVTSLSAQVNDVTSGLPATRATLLSFQSTQATLNTAVASDITSLNAALTTLGGTVSGQASAIAGLDARVTNTEGVNTSQASQLTSLDARLTSAEGVNGGQATAIAGLDARVTSAEGVNTSQASSITNLQSRMTSAEGVNTSQAGAISALDARVTSAEGVNTTQASQITSLTTTVAGKADASALSALDARVTSAEGVNTSQASAITGLTSSLSTANSNITANSSAITSLNSQVTSINGTLGSQASSIASLNTSVGSLSAGGLFQMVAAVSLPGGATSGWRALVKAADSGNFAEAGIEAYANAGGGGAPTGFFVLVGDRGYSRASGSSTLVKILDNDGKFVRLAMADGIATKSASYKRDGSEAAFSPGTGANSGTNGNGWADIVLASGVVLTANTGGVIGATGSKLLVRGDQTVNANITTSFPSASAGTVPSPWQNFWFELWVRLALRPAGGGADIEITPPAKFRSSPENDGFTVYSLMPELLNDVPTAGSAVIDAGTYTLLVQHRVGRTGYSIVGNTMSVKMRGIFTLEAKLL